MKITHAWRMNETCEIGKPMSTVTGANGERISLHKVDLPSHTSKETYRVLYIRYIKHLSKYRDGREDIEVCEPTHHTGVWPGSRKASCGCRTYHKCTVCGHPAWIECHGMASGQCEYCGHIG